MNQYGICFGGYCPMHRGHLDVIMKAKKECERVFVVVCGYDDEPRAKEIGLDLNKRYQLVKQLFKDDEQIQVMKVNDTELGLDESMSKENWQIWTEYVERTICDKLHEARFMFKPIYYVAERFYKKSLDSLFNKRCVCIDRTLPISGTAVRKQPILFFDKIVKTFQPYFVRNILIIGTASEGKTTLVKDLSMYFNIPKTVEYGRIYMEERNITDIDLIGNDFHQFISGQYEEYKKAVNSSTSGVTIQDTDNLVTLMYAWAYSEDPNINIDKHDYMALCHHAKSIQKYFNWDHIFVLTPNNTFVDDGTRYMAQASIEERQKNLDKLNKLIDEFGYDKNKITYLKGGEFENNFNIIKEYINGIFLGN